jgi:hypothetical protein
MSNTTIGREPIQIVEIQQPFCANTFGSAPCTATGTADTKCYNTRATCQDTANFDRSSLSLYFAKGMVADMGVSGAPYIIPSLVGVSTSPTKINLASSNRDAQGLGNRALCTITFQDHQHTDRRVDPYVSGRSWNPMVADRGTFWTRWLRRNKYRQNVVIKIYEGYAGEALGAMTVRTYFLQSVSGPDSNGRVVIQGKDVLARIEERKAQAPLASPGLLYAAITDSATSFEVANAVEADYAASGTLRIGDEIMTYTSRASSANGVTFSGVTRGTDNSTAAAHDVDDAVQQCLRYTNENTDDIVADLLATYGGISASYLDTANWATEFDTYMVAYRLTTLITEPTGVNELLSELQTQAMFYLWWDERAAKVKFKSIRGVDADPDTLTDSAHILEGSFSLSEAPRERVSQVWIYYNRTDFVKADDDPLAYASQFVVANLEAETDDLYGEKSIRKIFGRWLPTSALAENTASKLITRYVDIPSKLKFRMDAKDRAYWVGDTVKISHYLDVDDYGARRVRQWTITSAEEKVPGEVVEYTAEDTTLYGRIHYVMASGAADYPGYDSAPFKNCYIGDSSGLLSDGERAGKIS